MDIDRLLRVGQILDSCLTTETLKNIYPPTRVDIVPFEEGERGAENQLFVNLLEHSGEVVVRELGRELASDEVMMAFNRVRQFLIARGLD